MPRLDTLKVNEVLAVIGVLTGFLGAATAIVTARWNRRAVLSEEAIAALKQQMDLIKQQATQTETNLKEQLAYYKELSPADIQKQLTAVNKTSTYGTHPDPGGKA
jgi:type II secretory pathway pseudopilin PulG